MKAIVSILISLTVFTVFFAACKKKNDPPLPPLVTPPVVTLPASELIFNTGFENGIFMTASPASQFADFQGSDATLPSSSDWVNNFNNHPNIGNARLFYEQGDSSQRLAAIVPDPVNPTNKVLNYKINVPHIDVPLSSQYTVGGIVFDKKARIQMDIYGNNGLKEIYQSVRLYLPPDFNKLVASKYPANGDWFTLFEFWNNAQWKAGATYPFRFGISLKKATAAPGAPFAFHVEGQKFESNYVTLWEKTNTSFVVPIGKWMTLEYYIKEGNKGTGRFFVAVTPDGGTKTLIYDGIDDTCHPSDPAPDGLSEFNPIKLYTSNNLVNQMNLLGGKFQVYWDDFKIWKNKRP